MGPPRAYKGTAYKQGYSRAIRPVILLLHRFLWMLLFFPVTIFAQQREPVSSTQAEAARRSALIRVLRERQIPFEERPLFTEYGGFSSSVHVVISRSGTSESDITAKTLVLGIPFSNTEYGENQSLEGPLPFGFEIGLAFIEKIRAQGSAMDIRVAFLGDEISRLPMDMRKRSHIGLEDLSVDLTDSENTILLYLDIHAAPQSLLIYHGAGKTITALNVLKPWYMLCNFHKIPCAFAIRFNELYKLGILKGHPVIQFAHRQGINTLYLTGSRGKPYSKTDYGTDNTTQSTLIISREALTDLLVDYEHSIKISMENLDYHFFILKVPGRYIFISESITVMILFIIIGSVFLSILIYSRINRKRLILQWKIFIRFAWMFPILLLALLGSLWIAGSMVSLMIRAWGVSPLIKTFGMAILKIDIALLLFSLIFLLPNLLKMPRKANFYGNTAVLLVIVEVLIAAFFDITFIPIFIWIFLFTFLGASFKKPVWVYICALFTSLQGFCSLVSILITDNSELQINIGLQVQSGLPFLLERLLFSTERLTEILLSQNIRSFLYLVAITLPFMLLLERGIALAQRRRRPVPLVRRIFLSLIWLAISLGALVCYTYILAGVPFIEPVRRTIIEHGAAADSLHIQYRGILFLERRNIIITIKAQGTPISFNLYLDTEDETPLVIYSAPMPIELIRDQNAIAFILGEGPPNPFTAEIVLPLEFFGFLRAEAMYTSWDPAIDTMPLPESDDYVLQVIKRIPLSD